MPPHLIHQPAATAAAAIAATLLLAISANTPTPPTLPTPTLRLAISANTTTPSTPSTPQTPQTLTLRLAFYFAHHNNHSQISLSLSAANTTTTIILTHPTTNLNPIRLILHPNATIALSATTPRNLSLPYKLTLSLNARGTNFTENFSCPNLALIPKTTTGRPIQPNPITTILQCMFQTAQPPSLSGLQATTIILPVALLSSILLLWISILLFLLLLHRRFSRLKSAINASPTAAWWDNCPSPGQPVKPQDSSTSDFEYNRRLRIAMGFYSRGESGSIHSLDLQRVSFTSSLFTAASSDASVSDFASEQQDADDAHSSAREAERVWGAIDLENGSMGRLRKSWQLSYMLASDSRGGRRDRERVVDRI